MLNEIIKLRNKQQPTGLGNTDVVQFDYLFWTELDKLSTKKRQEALAQLLSVSEKPTVPGIIVASQKYKTTFKESAPIKQFDKELFIDGLLRAFPQLDRHKLREIATASVVEAYTRKTYIVEEIRNGVERNAAE